LKLPSRERKTGDSTSADVPLSVFDANCVACPRLARHLAEVRRAHPTYYARPVPPFGDFAGRLLIVGLGPGLHGANRTGRPFTGDYAGLLLYRTLHKYGFANHPGSDDPNDGLQLRDCRITNSVKCLPPQNKPVPDEVWRCNHYLAAELAAYPPKVVLALGRIAHEAMLRAVGLRLSAFTFAHGARHTLPNALELFDSYHCSRYNTQTGRLTEAMFEALFAEIARALNRRSGPGSS
jgi:uracil-DNA glycosylase family 4